MERKDEWSRRKNYARKIARVMKDTYHLDDADVEDFVQNALIRLQSIPQGRSTQYFNAAIKNSCRNSLKALLRRRRLEVCSINAPMPNTGDGEMGTYADVIPDTRKDSKLTLDSMMVKQALAVLDDEEVEIVKLHCGFDGHPALSNRAIGSLLHRDPKKVALIITTAFEKIREVMNPTRFHPYSYDCEACTETVIYLVPVHRTILPKRAECVCGHVNHVELQPMDLAVVPRGKELRVV